MTVTDHASQGLTFRPIPASPSAGPAPPAKAIPNAQTDKIRLSSPDPALAPHSDLLPLKTDVPTIHTAGILGLGAGRIQDYVGLYVTDREIADKDVNIIHRDAQPLERKRKKSKPA